MVSFSVTVVVEPGRQMGVLALASLLAFSTLSSLLP